MIVSGTKWTPDLSSAGRSKYKALAQAIRDGIAAGHLAPGEKLPPVRDLAYRIGVTPGTVARAYSLLVDELRLVAGVGRGTFVAERGGGPVAQTGPVMLDPIIARPDLAHLLSPKMPEVGQGAILRRGMTMLAHRMSETALLNYPTRITDLPAREAQFQTMQNAMIGPFTVDDIVCAHGGQSAIVMIFQTILHGQAPAIAVDELNYGGFRSAALISRAQVVGIPWDNDGPIVAAFEDAVRHQSVQVYCTSSEVNNPTARGTSVARRQDIAAVAERYGVHIIDDDCYRLMQVDPTGPSYRALLPTLGWSVTSPSKSIAASLRIGFAIAPDGWTASLVRTSTFNSFGVSRFVTDLFAYLMTQPELPDVIAAARTRVAQDIRAAVNILGRYDLSWSVNVPFFFVNLPIGWRAGEFCQAAEAQDVLIKAADDFALRDSRSHHAVRIAINGQLSHDHFASAMRQIRDLLDHPPERISV